MSKQQYRGLRGWLKRIQGFGFIEPEEGSADVYTHYTSDEPVDNHGQYHPRHTRRRQSRHQSA